MKNNTLVVIFGLAFSFISCKKEVSVEDYFKQKDSLQYFKQAYKAANYFSIEDNENARAMFTDTQVENAMDKVRFDLAQESNKSDGFLKIGRSADERIFINKAAVLNNKWIILDYYVKDETGNPVEVGELLLNYQYHAERPTEFHVLSSNVY
ncbi:hypothetical protein AB4865_10020 [Capnocytophaga sp. ARDL2]|uniref:hypothetical protein n=1 Tax=Capnocytophaga sp. ARDL2 TaxID=3238809 RepID=UPI0035588F62